MSNELAKSRPTLYLYTERDSGGALVESVIIGTINDYSGDKLLVVQDPYNDVKYVYQADFDTLTFNAVGVVNLPEEQFESRASVEINNLTYRLGSSDQAVKHLRKRMQWIQDKSAAMSVLLYYTASRRSKLSVPHSITRDRVLGIPPDTPIETLESIIAARNASAVDDLVGEPAVKKEKGFTGHFDQEGDIPQPKAP